MSIQSNTAPETVEIPTHTLATLDKLITRDAYPAHLDFFRELRSVLSTTGEKLITQQAEIERLRDSFNEKVKEGFNRIVMFGDYSAKNVIAYLNELQALTATPSPQPATDQVTDEEKAALREQGYEVKEIRCDVDEPCCIAQLNGVTIGYPYRHTPPEAWLDARNHAQNQSKQDEK